MDEGLPVAYEVLEKDVPVMASDGEQVGSGGEHGDPTGRHHGGDGNSRGHSLGG